MSDRYGDYEQVNGATVNALLDKVERLENTLKTAQDHLTHALHHTSDGWVANELQTLFDIVEKHLEN
jgi:uncharacterized protein (UPF0335 family)